MNLRRLELSDAQRMLMWMNDDSVTNDLYSDFASKTIEDAEKFIISSQKDEKILI